METLQPPKTESPTPETKISEVSSEQKTKEQIDFEIKFFQEYITKNFPYLNSYKFIKIKNSDDRDDILQETLARAQIIIKNGKLTENLSKNSDDDNKNEKIITKFLQSIKNNVYREFLRGVHKVGGRKSKNISYEENSDGNPVVPPTQEETIQQREYKQIISGMVIDLCYEDKFIEVGILYAMVGFYSEENQKTNEYTAAVLSCAIEKFFAFYRFVEKNKTKEEKINTFRKNFKFSPSNIEDEEGTKQECLKKTTIHYASMRKKKSRLLDFLREKYQKTPSNQCIINQPS